MCFLVQANFIKNKCRRIVLLHSLRWDHGFEMQGIREYKK